MIHKRVEKGEKKIADRNRIEETEGRRLEEGRKEGKKVKRA